MLAVLADLGLTESESKVYLALLDLGESTVGPIADRSGVAYSKIYILLQKLADKGLSTHINTEQGRLFRPTNPRRLLEYVDKQAQAVEKRKHEIEQLLPDLTQRFALSKELERAEIYEGYEGFRAVYQEGIEDLKEGDEILVMGASMGIYTDKSRFRRFFEWVNNLRQEKKISYRIIYNENLRGEEGVEWWASLPNTNVRYLLENTPGSVGIQGNKTLIIYWKPDNPQVISITSSIVADSFRQYFNALWEMSQA